jgi:hypothetical protein
VPVRPKPEPMTARDTLGLLLESVKAAFRTQPQKPHLHRLGYNHEHRELVWNTPAIFSKLNLEAAPDGALLRWPRTSWKPRAYAE